MKKEEEEEEKTETTTTTAKTPTKEEDDAKVEEEDEEEEEEEDVPLSSLGKCSESTTSPMHITFLYFLGRFLDGSCHVNGCECDGINICFTNRNRSDASSESLCIRVRGSSRSSASFTIDFSDTSDTLWTFSSWEEYFTKQ